METKQKKKISDQRPDLKQQLQLQDDMLGSDKASQTLQEADSQPTRSVILKGLYDHHLGK